MEGVRRSGGALSLRARIERRSEITGTITLFGRKCGYSRSMIATFTSLCNFAHRRTLRVSTSFNNNVKQVHRAYNTTYNVFLLTKLRGYTVRKGSHRDGTTGCTLIRRLTRRFGGQGNTLQYTSLLKLSKGRPMMSAPRTEARQCCTGHPYTEVIRRTTQV